MTTPKPTDPLTAEEMQDATEHFVKLYIFLSFEFSLLISNSLRISRNPFLSAKVVEVSPNCI